MEDWVRRVKKNSFKTIVTSAAAVVLLTSSWGAVGSAAAAKAVPVKAASLLTTASVNFDGKKVDLKAYKGLVSVREAAAALGAVLTYDGSQYSLYKDGVTVAITGTVKYNGALFADFDSLVKAIGGEAEADASGAKVYSSFKLLDGDNTNVRWAGNQAVIVSHNDDNGTLQYRVDALTKKADKLTSQESASETVVSPNGELGVYADDDNHIVSINLSNGGRTVISTDETSKYEIQFAANSSSVIYFIYGDKLDTIASLDLTSGKITKLVADTVVNKTDFRVSADGTKFLYTVTNSPKATETADKLDVSSIDFTNTDPQLFLFDTTEKDAKAKALTTTPDNKEFSALLSDGKVAYVSSDSAENSDKPSVLKLIGTDSKVTDLVSDVDVYEADYVAGKLYVLGLNASGSTVIYAVDPSGSKTKLYETSDDIDSAAFSADGSLALSVSGDAGSKIVVVKGGTAVDLTK